jgi:hypothetical protein
LALLRRWRALRPARRRHDLTLLRRWLALRPARRRHDLALLRWWLALRPARRRGAPDVRALRLILGLNLLRRRLRRRAAGLLRSRRRLWRCAISRARRRPTIGGPLLGSLRGPLLRSLLPLAALLIFRLLVSLLRPLRLSIRRDGAASETHPTRADQRNRHRERQ